MKLVYDGSNYPAVYSHTITSEDNLITCGVVYNVEVTAINSAGESSPNR